MVASVAVEAGKIGLDGFGPEFFSHYLVSDSVLLPVPAPRKRRITPNSKALRAVVSGAQREPSNCRAGLW